MNFSSGASKPKSWKEIWGSGQGISAVKSILPTSDLVKRINDEYIEAKNKLI
jgi:nitronate monooxygenase